MSRANDFAFPLALQGYGVHGLSIREYFAAAAMQGFCAANPTGIAEDGTKALKTLAKASVAVAYALLAELESS